jgi:VanZ family protein
VLRRETVCCVRLRHYTTRDPIEQRARFPQILAAGARVDAGDLRRLDRPDVGAAYVALYRAVSALAESGDSPETIAAVQFAIRKAAHVTEYAVLAALLLRALHGGIRAVTFIHAIVALGVASTYAALDEYHQSFIASRTGSPIDVVIDASGALLGVVICWWIITGGNRRRAI